MLSTRPKHGEPRTERREGPSAALLLQLGAGANSSAAESASMTAAAARQRVLNGMAASGQTMMMPLDSARATAWVVLSAPSLWRALSI